MALTFLQILTEVAASEGKTWDATAAGGTSDSSEEFLRYQYVQHVNAALRWVWMEHDPEFAWPWTVDDKTTTPTSGLITASTLSDTGDGSWCSLWTSDPRTENSTAVPVSATADHDGVHVLDGTASVFAFYRKAVPQGTWSAGASYSTPSTIPDQLRQPIVFKSCSLRLAALGQYDEADKRESHAVDWMNGRKAGLRNSGLIWESNILTF